AYQLSAEVYLLIVNASRTQEDIAWLKARQGKFPRRGELALSDASHHYSAVAVQGPRVREFIAHCVPGASVAARRVYCTTDLKKNEIGEFCFEHGGVLVSRTGYTGEDGFEIVGGGEAIQHVWNKILQVGEPFGIKPCGLGARDTLRTEACYPLYGHELDEETTPIEAGLGFFVSLEKGEFIGRKILAEQKANGVKKKLVAFEMTDKCAPPRPHYPVWANGSKVGTVTSGTQSPSLGIGIGMGFMPPEFSKPETKIEIEIRGKRFAAVVASKPIYKKG
ncbi:MAG TPA: glycine cleavage T C-terminal barrel domain-containing protein, partial [Candidatus Saccharimonadales bacterium]|nr:glycine cleavage T C-terminal barrel domain-containing protein [Candidatus Saccharimonadales bacterium]